MIRTTRWFPSTCGCVIEHDWDDTLTEAQRVHALKSISKCVHHEALTDSEAYAAVQAENDAVRFLPGQLAAVAPDFYDTETVLKNQGLPSIMENAIRFQIEQGHVITEPYSISFDAKRNVVLIAAKLTAAQSQDLQSMVKTKTPKATVIIN